MSKIVDLKVEIRNFNWKKLSRVRGQAHEGIIGGWISWWVEIDFENHLVFNPAPYVESRSADIVFLRKIEDIYCPLGVAEVENDPKKWADKIETLKVYEGQYSKLKTLKFLLLCVTTRRADNEKFERLIQQTRDVSKNSELDWMLYRLIKRPWKEDEIVWFYESIDNGEFFIVRKGELAT